MVSAIFAASRPVGRRDASAGRLHAFPVVAHRLSRRTIENLRCRHRRLRLAYQSRLTRSPDPVAAAWRVAIAFPTMSSNLTDALGADPPEAILALPADVADRLAEQIEDARRRQAAAMDKSVKAALKGVPLPFRGVVRKALLG